MSNHRRAWRLTRNTPSDSADLIYILYKSVEMHLLVPTTLSFYQYGL